MYLMFKKIVFFTSADTELKLTAKKERKKKPSIKFLNPCLPIYGFEFRLGPKH